MRYRFVCVGRLKEKYLEEAQKDYLKRLLRFGKAEVIEVKDEIPAGDAPHQEETARDIEAGRILSRTEGFLVACAPDGREYTSEEFAEFLAKLPHFGVSGVTFAVGGSTGLGHEVYTRADAKVSFSRMTMPHRLFRIVLLEQVFRACKIMNGHTYHK